MPVVAHLVNHSGYDGAKGMHRSDFGTPSLFLFDSVRPQECDIGHTYRSSAFPYLSLLDLVVPHISWPLEIS